MANHFDTRALHSGQRKETPTGTITAPIYQTSTFAQRAPGEHTGFNYARTANPGRAALEEALAALEAARHGIAFASGLSAAAAVIQNLKAGDHLIVPENIYGGCYRMFTQVFSKLGLEFSFVDTTRTEQVASAFKANTALLWLETPSNPLLRVTDIRACSALAKEHGALTVADNTFATPYLQNPLELGADVVLHSTTKYINGHADVIGGALVTNDADLAEQYRFIQNAVGAVPGPQDCFLISRGLRTLGLRMERHCANAEIVADFLVHNPHVARVYYPGLKDSEGYAVASKQQKHPGAMISFELKTGHEGAVVFTSSTKLFTLAESLGADRSLCNHPATMTHASMDAEARGKAGISDGLVRLSIGLEHPEDLVEDLIQAIKLAAEED